MDQETSDLGNASPPEINIEANGSNILKDTIEITQITDDFNNNNQESNGISKVISEQPNEIDQTTASVSNIEVPDEDANQNKEIEIDVNIHDESVMGDDPSLYDDVMGSGIGKDTREGDIAEVSASSVINHDHSGSTNLSTAINNNLALNSNKRVCCYIGNLSWWTTDKDISDAIASHQIHDLIDIKFYENKINGQSKGFALVTVGSDASFRILMEKLPRTKIQGQDPVVTHFNRHNFAQFEEQARKEFPSTAGTSPSTIDQNVQSGFTSNQQHIYMNSRNRNYNQSALNGPNSTTGLPLSRPNISNGISVNSILLGSRSNGQSQNFNSIASNGPGLVGSFPGVQHRIGHPQQQPSLLGNTPSGMLPIRQAIPQNSAYVGGSNLIGRTGNGLIVQHQAPHQQSSLLGNRPGIMPTVTNISGPQGPGLLPMRPGMTPIGSSNNTSQGPGLLNNPPNLPPRINSVSGQQSTIQNNWERQSQLNGTGILNSNALITPVNSQRNSTSSQIAQPCGLTQQGSQYIQANQYSMSTHPSSNMTSINGLINIGSNQPNHSHHHVYQQQAHIISNQVPFCANGPPSSTSYSSQTSINPHQSLHLQASHHHSHQSIVNETGYGSSVSNQNYNRQSSSGSCMNQSSSSGPVKMSEMEFQEALEKNRIISSQAISRAVQDASIGQYASAIETLVTAISLIKQSKISYDERCKIFASSLEDTKQGIEDKYYGSLNMMQLNHQHQHRLYGSATSSRETESQDRPRGRYERSRSRSRDSRDRDRDRVNDREPSSKEHRSHHRREKHHRSSHRDRDRERERSRSRDRSRDKRIVSVDRDDSYYEDSSNKYHRSSRH